MRRVIALAAVVFAGLLGGPTASATNMPSEGEDVVLFGLAFPEYAAGFQRGRLTDFQSERRGLGYSVGYGQGERRATVYVYDNGLMIIATELDSNTVKQQFAHVQREVTGNVGPNRYSRVTPGGLFSVADNEGTARFLCASFEIEQDQKVLDSFSCLTSWQDNFVKIRLSMPKGPDGAAEARRFAGAWTEILWPRAQRPQADAMRGRRFVGLLYFAKVARQRCGFEMSSRQEKRLAEVLANLQVRARLTKEQADALLAGVERRFAAAGPAACDVKGRHADLYRTAVDVMLRE